MSPVHPPPHPVASEPIKVPYEVRALLPKDGYVILGPSCSECTLRNSLFYKRFNGQIAAPVLIVFPESRRAAGPLRLPSDVKLVFDASRRLFSEEDYYRAPLMFRLRAGSEYGTIVEMPTKWESIH